MTEILNAVGVEGSANLISLIVIFISICAMLTCLVTDALKSIPSVDALPSKLVCYVVAIIITTPSFCAMMAFMKKPVEWFMVFASFLASFLVAKVAMNGWDDVTELAERMTKK